MDEQLISIYQAAAELGVRVGVLHALARAERLPVYKRVGVRSNQVFLSEARRAVLNRRPRGWPKGRPRKFLAQAS